MYLAGWRARPIPTLDSERVAPLKCPVRDDALDQSGFVRFQSVQDPVSEVGGIEVGHRDY